MNKCKNCGHINPDNAKFCEKCGSPLSGNSNTLPNSKKKNYLPFIIGGIVILLVIIGGYFTFNHFKQRSQDHVRTETSAPVKGKTR